MQWMRLIWTYEKSKGWIDGAATNLQQRQNSWYAVLLSAQSDRLLQGPAQGQTDRRYAPLVKKQKLLLSLFQPNQGKASPAPTRFSPSKASSKSIHYGKNTWCLAVCWTQYRLERRVNKPGSQEARECDLTSARRSFPLSTAIPVCLISSPEAIWFVSGWRNPHPSTTMKRWK